MKKDIVNLIIVLLVISCSTSNDVVKNRFIQKRKYNKGYYVEHNKSYNHSKTIKKEDDLLFDQQDNSVPVDQDMSPDAKYEPVTDTVKNEYAEDSGKKQNKTDKIFIKENKELPLNERAYARSVTTSDYQYNSEADKSLHQQKPDPIGDSERMGQNPLVVLLLLLILIILLPPLALLLIQGLTVLFLLLILLWLLTWVFAAWIWLAGFGSIAVLLIILALVLGILTIAGVM